MKISKMMTIVGIGSLAIGLLVLPMNADAGRFRGAHGGGGAGGGANFVDSDGNCVCDYFDTNMSGYTDANGNGINDYYEAGGAGFVDADNNGVCDLFENGRRGGGRGHHRKW